MLIFFLCAIGVYLLLKLFPYMIVYVTSLGYTFYPMKLVAIDQQEVSSEIHEVLHPWAEKLGHYGFTIAGYHHMSSDTHTKQPYLGVSLQHHSQKFFAELIVYPKPNSQYQIACGISSYWNEIHLITISTHDFSTHIQPNIERTKYLNQASIEELWLGHQDFLASICLVEDLQIMSHPEWEEKLQQTARQFALSLVKAGKAYWVEESEMTYRNHPYLIFKHISKIARYQNFDHHRNFIGSTDIDEKDEETRIESEVQAYLESARKVKARKSLRQRIWIPIGSFLLFLLAHSFQFQPIQLIIFAAVLLYHELGHTLAMLAFGYRDTTILFIPWLGALATGNKENATLTEKFWIYLAGPLPGIILAVLLMIAFPQNTGWLRAMILMLLSLNLSNLLPLYPLDGGQIIQLLLFSRHPYLTVVFQSIGVLLLGSLGLLQPVLLIFACLIAFRIPHSFRLAKIISELRKGNTNLFTDSQEDSVANIVRYLSRSKYNTLSIPDKFLLINEILNNQKVSTSRRTTRMGLFTFYITSLIGSCIGGIYIIAPNIMILSQVLIFGPKHYLESYAKSTIDQANNQLKKNPQNIDAYIMRGNGYYRLQNYMAALTDANTAIQLNPEKPSAYFLRSEIKQKLGDLKGSKEDLNKSIKISTELALKESDLAVQQNPNNPQLYVDRGDHRNRMNDRKGAMSDYEASLKISPQNTPALLGMANIKIEEQKYSQALEDINYVIKIEPNNPKGYLLRAELYNRTGNPNKAEQDIQKADSLEE
jgi:tetratricopeptide (TPR) repeat protein/Zn-dependent protease